MVFLARLSRTVVSFLLLSTALTSAIPSHDDQAPKPKSKGFPFPKAAQKNSTTTVEPKKPLDPKKPQDPKRPLTVTTEKSADCNEFPDPGYGGSDPDTYKFWPESSRINVQCYSDKVINGINYTYLRTASGCYVDEMSIIAGNKDYTSLLPKCGAVAPYQVWTTKNEYLLEKDGFWMSCYMQPKKEGKKIQVQWGARHVSCSVEGEKVNGDETWWRDAHSLKGSPESHCYVPDDAFDNMVYELPGAGKSCKDFDVEKRTRH